MKILLEELHKKNIDWDEEIRDELLHKWVRCLDDIESIGRIEVSRRFEEGNSSDPVVKRELHGFSDASEQGYGACIYVRSICESGKISVKLLTSKSRVAPIKKDPV